MAKQANISLKNIEALKKRLQKLPMKDALKSREEAVEILEASFQDALQKGYTRKELRALFAEEGVALPLSLLKKPTAPKQEHFVRNCEAELAAEAVQKEAEVPVEFTIKPDTPGEEV